MARTISVGAQDFAKIRENNYFYIDKTDFIREWWDGADAVTLITRPRRFGKTLNMSMVECFFSNKYADRGDLFEGLSIWQDEKFRAIQGTYPVIFLSFAGIKHTDYANTRERINKLLADIYNQHSWMLADSCFTETDRENFKAVNTQMSDSVAAGALNQLCEWFYRYYGKKCIILLDEYDTPLQEAYINGFWDELVGYTRALFNNTFKTNPYLERGLMTGITRVSKESIFSDLNNLNVVTTTSKEYMTCFGFTEREVFDAMREQGIPEMEQAIVKRWYDGFTFGTQTDIYNPWSVTMFLDKKEPNAYWANTSGNGLINTILREGDRRVKQDFEKLLANDCIEAVIDEQIIFDQLTGNPNAIWSLLLASGYLKVDRIIRDVPEDEPVYVLRLTNFEVKRMFYSMVSGWFSNTAGFGDFITAMLAGDEESMNEYMNEIALDTFSFFDVGKHSSSTGNPERFYHGFVLGLLVDKSADYILKSNRESGFGRYDVVMEPKNNCNKAIIMEFKVLSRKERDLDETADKALKQIEEKRYEADLLAKGIPSEHILKYGFAFEGKKCLIKKSTS
ncbi:PD-(D/E)XK nuclease superfamily protein [Lachnospiraceae bacterium XBB1006]|nr:PD-(D/E)XK nuclease superfamily protein [Lachnospiraceae bacterium XBB1006]